MAEKPMPRCVKCNIALELAPVTLEYLGHSFDVELPRCPKCGQVLVMEELVRGKIKKVETTLEDK